MLEGYQIELESKVKIKFRKVLEVAVQDGDISIVLFAFFVSRFTMHMII